jgi:hypothetical protein
MAFFRKDASAATAIAALRDFFFFWQTIQRWRFVFVFLLFIYVKNNFKNNQLEFRYSVDDQ